MIRLITNRYLIGFGINNTPEPNKRTVRNRFFLKKSKIKPLKFSYSLKVRAFNRIKQRKLGIKSPSKQGHIDDVLYELRVILVGDLTNLEDEPIMVVGKVDP